MGTDKRLGGFAQGTSAEHKPVHCRVERDKMRQGQRALAIRAALVVVVLAVVGGPGPACGATAARAEAERGQVRAEREMLPAASSQILFERVVCYLGQVGVGTGTLCEFRFGSSGYAPLKITGVKATCGCTVVQLEKREYAPAEFFSSLLTSAQSLPPFRSALTYIGPPMALVFDADIG
jgi:hypothetical protein